MGIKISFNVQIYIVDVLLNASVSEGKSNIDNYVYFGHGVKVLARGHDYKYYNYNRQQNVTEQSIHICGCAWIGTNSIIMGGVTIVNTVLLVL